MKKPGVKIVVLIYFTEMTDKIKEISNKAKELVPKGTLNVEEWIDSYNNIMLKLIIDECVQIMREQEHIPTGFLYAKGTDIHELAIKKHFGVEND